MSTMLRPLTLGELLDRAFQLYRSRFAVFAGIAAVAYLPSFVVTSVRLWVVKPASGFASATITMTLVSAVVNLICVAAAQSATIMAVSAAYLDRPITLGEAYGRVSGMLVRVSLIMIGMGIGITIGFVLLIVPGVILFLMWALAVPVAVLEDAGLGESLSRSRDLTAGHRGRVFVIYLLYFALLLALESALLAPFGFAVALRGATGGAAALSATMLIATAVVGYVIECLVTPILTISLSLMYYDERVRKEAFDIQLMMASLGEGPAQSAAAGVS